MSRQQSYQTQIEELKERGLYGSTKDPQWNRETKRHDCCGAKRAYYHHADCPLATGGGLPEPPEDKEPPRATAMMKKTEYSPTLTITRKSGDLTFEVQKTYLCDMGNANACQRRAPWYGYQTIGPRVYAVYYCPQHKIFNVRIHEKELEESPAE